MQPGCEAACLATVKVPSRWILTLKAVSEHAAWAGDILEQASQGAAGAQSPSGSDTGTNSLETCVTPDGLYLACCSGRGVGRDPLATDLLQFAKSVNLVQADLRGWWADTEWPSCNWTGIACSRRDDNRQLELTTLALPDANLSGK